MPVVIIYNAASDWLHTFYSQAVFVYYISIEIECVPICAKSFENMGGTKLWLA